ncbi:MAG TPA: hypothetical protein VMT63_09820 [Bacteroidales bacterium]|nr:hypothetical protein [Bacteroidales bacterium]
MKRCLTFILFLSLLTKASLAQELFKQTRIEAVAGAGISQFFGDIGGYTPSANIIGIRDIILHQTRFNIEGALKYRILKDLSVKVSLSGGMFHAADTRGSNEVRGMEASTFFLEPAVTGEYYFIKSRQEGKYSFFKGKQMMGSFFSFIDFYAFTGFGGLSYSVKGNSTLVNSGMKKGGFTAVIPVGIGANFLYSSDYSFGLELGGRYTFSDYLDGYSSKYSKSNDVYYLMTFTFTYRIPTLLNGMPKFMSKRRY